MTTRTAVDISEFQPPVTDAYPHRWLILRCCDGSYVDRNLAHNLAWAVYARKTGKLDGYTVYVVYEPGQNNAILANLDAAHVPADCTIMIDVESWGGKIHGNHSGEINALARALAKRQGSPARVWGYANRGDYAAIWLTRPKWLGLVVASYGGSKPDSPGPGPLVGWQYTDGQYQVPGLPNSSPPFGRCDHNQLYISQEDDMSDAQVKQILNAINGIPHDVWAFDNGGDTHAWALLNVSANPARFAQALLAALPPAAKGGLTEADVETAVRKVLDDATIQTGA